MKAAARDHIRDRCIQLDQHSRNRQEVLRKLQSQQQSILDFRQLVVRAKFRRWPFLCPSLHQVFLLVSTFVYVFLQVLRQEHIRGLIKGNSSAKMELIRLHAEVWMFSICNIGVQQLYDLAEFYCEKLVIKKGVFWRYLSICLVPVKRICPGEIVATV